MNYPDNVDPKSKDCPWNEKDPETQKCDECNGNGKFNDRDSDGNWIEYQCEYCEGTGLIEIDDEDQKAAEGDRAYDAWKDSQLEGD